MLFTLLIVDKDNNPLPGVKVQNLETNQIMYTNFEGELSLPEVDCQYSIDMISYQDTVICWDDSCRSTTYKVVLNRK